MSIRSGSVYLRLELSLPIGAAEIGAFPFPERTTVQEALTSVRVTMEMANAPGELELIMGRG